jgi:hypothetical protein
MKTRIAPTLFSAAAGLAVGIALLMMLFTPTLALAATNQATGDIAGVDADLADSNTFTMTSQALALVKKAFDASGTAIADSSTLAKGTTVKFLIYVNNKVDQATNDVSLRDILAATFLYQAGTLKTSTAVAACALLACTGAEEAAIFTDVNGTAAKTDAVDADVVSIAGTTIDAGNQNVANGALNIPANTVFALLFTVVLQ